MESLFWDYVPIAPPNGKTDQVFYKMEQPAKPAATTTLRIAGMKDGGYTLSVYRIGYEQNDAYTAYLHMGAPNQLTRNQVAMLQAKASGAPVEARSVTVTHGSFEQKFKMRENDVVLVVLKR